MKLLQNSVFANLFYTNVYFQTFVHFSDQRILIKSKLVISAHYLSFSSFMPILVSRECGLFII